MIQKTWQGSYDDSWRDLITDESFAHPAKMARGLIVRIFDHAFQQGWLQPGSVVVDPFGGIGSTGIEAASRGVQAFLCELEPRFVELAQKNFELHRPTWEACGDPLPVIVQGDSRRLCEVLMGPMADCVVSSPPFAESLHDKPSAQVLAGSGARLGAGARQEDGYGTTPGQLGAMKPGSVADVIVGSPPFAENPNAVPMKRDRDRDTSDPKQHGGPGPDYIRPNFPGNLGNMPTGTVSAVISSPPYASGTVHDGNGIDPSRLSGNKTGKNSQAVTMDEYGRTPGNLGNLPTGSVDACIGSPPFLGAHSGANDETSMRPPHDSTKALCAGYGQTEGQLGAMPTGSVEAAVQADLICSSPPFEATGQVCTSGVYAKWQIENGRNPNSPSTIGKDAHYGTTPGNVGNDTGDTFWQAARQIVDQCFQILRPGGVAIWVTKRFVRNGQIQEFSKDWERLCHSIGFETIEWIQASLVKRNEQPGLFGEPVVKTKSRMSFFRRLHVAKYPHLAIEWEDVIVVRKPLTE